MIATDIFSLSERIAIVTGGAGFLGRRHCEAIADASGIPVILDHNIGRGKEAQAKIHGAHFIATDITDRAQIEKALDVVLKRYGRIDILINNAANNPKVEPGSKVSFSRMEQFPLSQWEDDLNVGLKGAFLCTQVFGGEMYKRKSGVILNIASELAVIAPDQRLYRKEGVAEDEQPVKPVTYPVVKSGLLGLTRYCATYYAPFVRVNALSPGGVQAGQPQEFLERIALLTPLGRMARETEYQGAILFLCSDASSFMTGQNLIIDGGRSCW